MNEIIVLHSELKILRDLSNIETNNSFMKKIANEYKLGYHVKQKIIMCLTGCSVAKTVNNGLFPRSWLLNNIFNTWKNAKK